MSHVKLFVLALSTVCTGLSTVFDCHVKCLLLHRPNSIRILCYHIEHPSSVVFKMAELRGSRASSSPAAIPKLQIPGSPPETAGGGEPVEEAWDPLSLWGLFNARCIIVAMVCNKFVVCELGRGGCRLTLHDSATRHRLRVTEL